MEAQTKREWAKWYGKELGLTDERVTQLVAMVMYATHTVMPDCEYCSQPKERSALKRDIPVYKQCECIGSVQEWRRLERQREKVRRQREMDEWEEQMLSKSVESGSCPSSSVGADWHGVKRGPVGKRAEDEVKAWTERSLAGTEKKWLYLYGPRGTGKTTMAGLIVQQAIRAMEDCRYIRWSGLLYDIKAAWSDKNRQDPLEELKRVKLLILDDFGKDAGSEWVASTAFELIDKREQAGLQTVFTSNYSISGAADRLGDDKASAIEDRMRGMCTVIQLGGESHR